MLGVQSGLGAGRMLKAKWDASQIPQTSSKSSPMTEQQPIIVPSCSPSPIPSETNPWVNQHPASPVPSSVSDTWTGIHPSVESSLPDRLQVHIDIWRGNTNPRPTSVETRIFICHAGDVFQHFADFEAGMVRVMNQVSRS